MRAGILLWSAAPLFIRLQSFTSQQIDPLARFRKQPTVVPDAASSADPPPAVPPVLDVNNVARFKRATAADNVNIPTIASDPLARFKRQRKSESSSISSSPSAPATSSSSSSSYSIGGLNYLPPNAPNFFNTILPTLHNETLTPGCTVSSGEITAAEKAALPLHIRYNAPIKRRLAALSDFNAPASERIQVSSRLALGSSRRRLRVLSSASQTDSTVAFWNDGVGFGKRAGMQLATGQLRQQELLLLLGYHCSRLLHKAECHPFHLCVSISECLFTGVSEKFRYWYTMLTHSRYKGTSGSYMWHVLINSQTVSKNFVHHRFELYHNPNPNPDPNNNKTTTKQQH
eukprot:g1771.t1